VAAEPLMHIIVRHPDLQQKAIQMIQGSFQDAFGYHLDYKKMAAFAKTHGYSSGCTIHLMSNMVEYIFKWITVEGGDGYHSVIIALEDCNWDKMAAFQQITSGEELYQQVYKKKCKCSNSLKVMVNVPEDNDPPKQDKSNDSNENHEPPIMDGMDVVPTDKSGDDNEDDVDDDNLPLALLKGCGCGHHCHLLTSQENQGQSHHVHACATLPSNTTVGI
jgi:hypothetical protein